jgi:hypothetical protein
MKKRILYFASVVLVIAVVISLSVFAVSYSDTKGHWGEAAINEWSSYGVIQGANGKFRPNDAITRAELAKILSFTLKLTEKANNTFTDLPDAWYTEDVLKCVAAGIMKGDGNGTIRPTASITREEAFVMVGRALKIQEDTNPDLSKFTDGAKVSSWAKGYLSQLVSLGYINGMGENMMAPRTNINRASVVTILSNAIANYVYTDGAKVSLGGNDGGIVVIAAKNVTLSGTARGPILVAEGAANGDLKLTGNAGKVEITADNVKVTVENATVLTIAFGGKGGKLEKIGTGLVVSTSGSYENIENTPPVVPDIPETPTLPQEPVVPETPDVPDEPVVPETPEVPLNPSNPGSGGFIEDGGIWTPLA